MTAISDQPRDRKQLIASGKRAQVKRLLDEGMSASKIAKTTGMSYKHVSLIVKQESGTDK